MRIKTIDQVVPVTKIWQKAVSDAILVVGLVSFYSAVRGFIWFFDRPKEVKILLVLMSIAIPSCLWWVLS